MDFVLHSVASPSYRFPFLRLLCLSLGFCPIRPSSLPPSVVLVAGKSLPKLSNQMLEAIFVQK